MTVMQTDPDAGNLRYFSGIGEQSDIFHPDDRFRDQHWQRSVPAPTPYNKGYVKLSFFWITKT